MLKVRTWAFSKGDISREIPPQLAVAKNSGFTPQSPWESPVSVLNPEFLATALCRNRYPLEKRGMASKRNRMVKTDHDDTYVCDKSIKLPSKKEPTVLENSKTGRGCK